MEELPFILVFVSLSTLYLFPQLLLPLSLASHDLIVLCLGWCCSLPVPVSERFLAFLIPLAYRVFFGSFREFRTIISFGTILVSVA